MLFISNQNNFGPTSWEQFGGSVSFLYGSGSRVNFDTDPDLGKNNTNPDPAKKD